MSERLMEFRKSLFGSNKTGVAFYSPAALGPAKWFAQVISEWIAITPTVADAVERLPQKQDVQTMVDALDCMGVALPRAFLHRDKDTVFPWSNIITTGDDADKWKRFAGMQKKLASERFQSGAPVVEDREELRKRAGGTAAA